MFNYSQFLYKMPDNFDGNNPAFTAFKKLDYEDIKPVDIKLFTNVNIANNSVIYKNRKIVRESCITEENYLKYSRDYRFFFKFILPYPNFSKKDFLLITDEWTTNYYHWHIYALQRLLAFKEQNLLTDKKLFLPLRYKKYNFVLDSLRFFGIKDEQLFFVPRKSHIAVNRLYFADIYKQNPFAFNKISQIIREAIENQDLAKLNIPNLGDKIYISREKQILRRVENEDKIMPILESFGFKKLIAEDYSYQQQLAIMKQAKYLVAPHGAGLTQMMFMQPKSSILEIHNQGNRLSHNYDYYKLARMLDFNYLYQDAIIGDSSKVKDSHHGNLIIDEKELIANLELMFLKTKK